MEYTSIKVALAKDVDEYSSIHTRLKDCKISKQKWYIDHHRPGYTIVMNNLKISMAEDDEVYRIFTSDVYRGEQRVLLMAVA